MKKENILNAGKKACGVVALVSLIGFGSVASAKMYQGQGGSGYNQGNCGAYNMQGNCPNYQQNDGYMMNSGKKGIRYLMGTILSLDLTKEQEEKINSIIEEHFQDVRAKTDISTAFTSDKFDKKRFIQTQNRKEIMAESKANMIDKIYKVLSSEQKAELKKEIDDYMRFVNKNPYMNNKNSKKQKGYNR